MTWEIMVLIFLASVFLFLAMGQWISFALSLSGILLLFISGGILNFSSLSLTIWNNANSYIFVAIPLFIFMGQVILISGASRLFYDGVSSLLYKYNGSLLYSNILACAIFSAVSGSSAATAITVGTVAFPEMTRKGYASGAIIGSLAAGGTLGILIPPSIVMILYGALVQENIAKLFIAGIIPGILLALLFMAYIRVVLIFKKDWAPKRMKETKISFKERLKKAVHIIPILMLLIVVLGGIYMGLTTPTESSAIGALGSLILAASYRGLSFRVLRLALLASVRTSSMLLFILLGAQVLATGLAYAGITRGVSDWIVSINLSKWTFFTAIVVLVIMLGFFVEGLTIIFLTLPVLFQPIVAMGFNTLWFGIILTLLIELGQITPPVGVNLFAIQSVSGRPIEEVAKCSVGYVFIILAMIWILVLFPQLALWLPSKM